VVGMRWPGVAEVRYSLRKPCDTPFASTKAPVIAPEKLLLKAEVPWP